MKVSRYMAENIAADYISFIQKTEQLTEDKVRTNPVCYGIGNSDKFLRICFERNASGRWEHLCQLVLSDETVLDAYSGYGINFIGNIADTICCLCELY